MLAKLSDVCQMMGSRPKSRAASLWTRLLACTCTPGHRARSPITLAGTTMTRPRSPPTHGTHPFPFSNMRQNLDSRCVVLSVPSTSGTIRCCGAAAYSGSTRAPRSYDPITLCPMVLTPASMPLSNTMLQDNHLLPSRRVFCDDQVYP